MLDEKTAVNFIQNLDGVSQGYPFGKKKSVFSRDGENFALIYEGTVPLRLSLRCEPKLAALLRSEYETVMPASDLSPQKWNTVLCTGQLDEQEVKDLIVHAYHLVAGDSADITA